MRVEYKWCEGGVSGVRVECEWCEGGVSGVRVEWEKSTTDCIVHCLSYASSLQVHVRPF